jgi:hypothetical protein
MPARDGPPLPSITVGDEREQYRQLSLTFDDVLSEGQAHPRLEGRRLRET